MKYFLLALCSIATLLLTACSFPQQEKLANEWNVELPSIIEQQESLTETETKETSPSWISEGYTGAIAVITEANSGDRIIQTGDQLLYRNEIYGFQILLGKETKSSEIQSLEDTILRSWDYNMSDDEENPRTEKLALLGITAMEISVYENMTGVGAFWIPQKELLEDNTIGKNNEYYFILDIYTNTDHGEISDNLPYLECKTINIHGYPEKSCGMRGERLLAQNFSTFDR